MSSIVRFPDGTEFKTDLKDFELFRTLKEDCTHDQEWKDVFEVDESVVPKELFLFSADVKALVSDDVNRMRSYVVGLCYLGGDKALRALYRETKKFVEEQSRRRVEDFFREYIDKVNWYGLSQNPSLSEAFFRENISKVDWRWLSYNPSLSEAFFRENINKVYWDGLSYNSFKNYRTRLTTTHELIKLFPRNVRM